MQAARAAGRATLAAGVADMLRKDAPWRDQIVAACTQQNLPRCTCACAQLLAWSMAAARVSRACLRALDCAHGVPFVDVVAAYPVFLFLHGLCSRALRHLPHSAEVRSITNGPLEAPFKTKTKQAVLWQSSL